MTTKNTVAGFEFVKLGDAYLSDKFVELTYNKKKQLWNVALKPVDERFLRAEESVYLVFVDETVVYVGEYSKTFRDRWLTKGCYIWHSVDVQIRDALNAGHQVSIWIAEFPYLPRPDGQLINVSKAIEHDILKSAFPPEWNKRNAGMREDSEAIPVREIIGA